MILDKAIQVQTASGSDDLLLTAGAWSYTYSKYYNVEDFFDSDIQGQKIPGVIVVYGKLLELPDVNSELRITLYANDGTNNYECIFASLQLLASGDASLGKIFLRSAFVPTLQARRFYLYDMVKFRIGWAISNASSNGKFNAWMAPYKI